MNALTLIKPTTTHIAAITAYRDDFRQHDDHSHGDQGLYDQPDIPAWIDFCRKLESPETAEETGYVPADLYMLVRADEANRPNPRILGMINFRHSLGEEGGYLAEHGGHIGFGIRPTERRKGYAKAMLLLCLEKCRAFGLEKVLLTCDVENEASRRTIQACGGQFERLAITGDEIDNRYWITLSATSENPIPPLAPRF